MLVLSDVLTAGLTAPSMFITSVLKHQFGFTGVMSFLVVQIAFVSNVFSPTSLMLPWLATIAGLYPVSVTISGMRALVHDGWIGIDAETGGVELNRELEQVLIPVIVAVKAQTERRCRWFTADLRPNQNVDHLSFHTQRLIIPRQPFFVR